MAEMIERAGAEEMAIRQGIGRLLDRLATQFTMVGGLIFCALIAMSIVSIVGRKLFATPVQGDVELMQMGAAVGAAAFLPLCELWDHNVKVDALTSWMSERARARLDTVAHLMLTVAAVLITWRTSLAVVDGYSSGEVSTLLTIPMWQPVALLVPSFALLALCGLYRSVVSLGEAMGENGMSGMAIGITIFACLMCLLVFRIHVGIGMFFAGSAAFLAMNHGDFNALLFTLNNLAYARLSNYDLAVIPLFMLMGQFATNGGLSKALFRCAAAFIGQFRGGLAMAATGACAGFGAICGSSLATAATMGQVALPELRAHGYSGRLATGTLAAAGTLGILIPPSVPLVIYAVLTQESIGKLFVAAVIPGLIATFGYMAVIRLFVTLNPGSGPAGPRVNWTQRMASVLEVLPVVGVFLVVIVGIYGGWANPTEAASIGAAACGVLAFLRGGMRWPGLRTSIIGTAHATAMIYMVLLGADVLNAGLAITQLPGELATWVKGSGMPPMLVMASILVIYVLLGCVMDSLAMILLTIPIFYPVVMGLDFHGMGQVDKSIWFGILALMVVEIGLVHPPLGMNLFIIQKLSRDTPYLETAKGVMPFLASDLLRIVLLVLAPGVCLWLVHLNA